MHVLVVRDGGEHGREERVCSWLVGLLPYLGLNGLMVEGSCAGGAGCM